MALREQGGLSSNRQIETSPAARAEVLALFNRAHIAAANTDVPMAIPLTINSIKSSVVEDGVAAGLIELLSPGSPGDDARYQIGLDAAHIKQMIPYIKLGISNDPTLDDPTRYSQQISLSIRGEAITLRAGRFPDGVRMAFVTKPHLLPALSGA